jgi:hypothetical protein
VSRRLAVVAAGIAYAAIGIGFAALGAIAHDGFPSRWAAWLVSAIVFGCHVLYEQRRLRDRPSLYVTALRVAGAAALGALVVAISASFHHTTSAENARRALALVIWPVAMMILAFPAALALATIVRKR